MVGRQILDLSIGVRIPDPQQKNFASFEAEIFSRDGRIRIKSLIWFGIRRRRIVFIPEPQNLTLLFFSGADTEN